MKFGNLLSKKRAKHAQLKVFVPSMGTDLAESVCALALTAGDPETRQDVDFIRQDLGTGTLESADVGQLCDRLGLALKELTFPVKSLDNLGCPCILIFENGLSALLKQVDGNLATLQIADEAVDVRAQDVLRVTTKALGTVHAIPTPQPECTAEPGTPPSSSADTDLPNPGLIRLMGHVYSKKPTAMSLIMVTAFIGNLMMIALPLFVMSVYDRVIPHSAFETLWALALGVLIAISIDLGVRYVRLKLADSVSLSITQAMQIRLMQRLTGSKLENTPRNTASWTSGFRDLEATISLVPALIPALIVDLPFVCIVLALIFSIAGPVVLAPIGGIAFFAIWTLIGMHALKKRGGEDSKHTNAKTELLAETSSVIRTLKTIGAEDQRVGVFQKLLRDATRAGHEIRLTTGLQPQVTMLSVQVVMVAAIVIGVYQISAGLMSVGALAASTLLVGRVLLPAGTVVSLTGRAFQFAKSYEHVCRLLKLPQEESLDHLAPRIVKQGKLSLNAISFKFSQSPVNALSDISLTVEPGERIALIGRSGSGKSTLLQVLVRLLEPGHGSYKIDEFDARQFEPRSIRSTLSYMPQETELIAGTLAENLMLAYPNASQDDLLKALEIAAADDFVRSNAYGLSLPVGRNGEGLSGGERQSIGLARALLRPSKLLLLDEPTSALDNTTENRVIRALSENLGDKTLIVATHRVSLLALVDRVIWMDGGRIVADGPRDQVLAKLKAAA